MEFNKIEIDETEIERIDTTLPREVKKYIKENGWKANELIRLGILAKEGNPQLIERVREVERKFQIIESKLNTIIELIRGRISEMDTFTKGL